MNLISLFSSEVETVLRGLAARIDQLAPAGGPKVIIVPGLPGSSLGHKGTPDDVIWFDFGAVRDGRIVELARPNPIDVLGLIEALFLRMIVRLRIAGFDVGIHAYDWRQPIPDVAAGLAAEINKEGREVHLIAYSFGALVARAAIMLGTPNLGRVVMLGPPNQGAFVMVQAVRGSAWPLHLMSAVDRRHGTIELAQNVVGTWPSVVQAFPSRLAPTDLDLFDLAQWPTDGLRPSAELLAEAARVQQWIAPSAGRFSIIAGYGLPTVDRIERDGGAFRYHGSDAGDGFVALDRTPLGDAPRYFVKAGHIGMPNHPDVIEAVHDLLSTGDTDKLPRTAPDPGSQVSFTDTDPPLPPFVSRGASDLDEADLHAFFDQLLGFAAPTLVSAGILGV